MRVIDHRLAIEVSEYWMGKRASAEGLCPLLADLDRLLAYLDERDIRPGRVIDPCPECGQEHRWALLNSLMFRALELRPTSQSRMLQVMEERLAPVLALYGGVEGYRDMRKKADEYFSKVGADNVYTP